MLPITPHINLILNQLKNRLELVVTSGNSVKDGYTHLNPNYQEFKRDLSYFMHYIFSTDELRYEFEELLTYREKVRRSQHFTDLLNKVSTDIKALGEYLSELDAFGIKSSNVDQRMGGQFVNVFSQLVYPVCGTEELIKTMALGPDMTKFTREKFITLSNILCREDGLGSICTYWSDSSDINSTQIMDNTLCSLKEIITELEYMEEYEYQFIKADAAEELMQFYLVTNPRHERNLPPNLLIFKRMINEGKASSSIPRYIVCCQKICEYLINNLSTRLSKKSVLERFKAYVEVFRASDYVGRDVVGEKEFQKLFEEFIFYHGLYPLTEVPLGDGRLDTLSLSADQAFLCEIKQVGFEKRNETQLTVDTKVKLGMHEPTIYHSRLQDFPNLLPEVNVIIFSKIEFGLSKSECTVNGLHYYFYVINLAPNSPSKQKNFEVIDPESLFLKQE